MAMSDKIHLWNPTRREDRLEPRWTKCGLYIRYPTNVLWASTAQDLRIPPDRVCKVCYRLGPPWLAAVK